MPDATAAPPADTFLAAFDAAPAALAMFDVDGRLVYVNARFCTLIGAGAAVMQPDGAVALVPDLPPPLATAAASAVRLLADGRPCPATVVTIADPAGGRRLEAEWGPVRTPSGELTHMSCAVRDVSREHAAEAALWVSEERFRSFMSNSPLTAWIVDAEGRFVYASPGYERHFPDKSPLTDQTIRGVFPADIAEEYLRNNAEVLASGERREAIETGVRPDGAQGRYFTVKFPLRDAAGGQLIGGIALDVTDLAAAERQALESETRFGAIFDNAAVGIAQVAMGGALVRVNRRLAEILGYPPEELLGKRFVDITHPDDIAENLAHSQKMRAGEIDEFAMEKRYVRKDGSIVWANLNVRCVRDSTGAIAYFVSVVEDISARKQAQDRVQLLVAEVNHRAKNMLAVVQAIARQTARAGLSTFVDRFSRRVQSLAAAQDLFIASAWGPVPLRDLITTQLAPFADVDGARLAIDGPDVDIKPSAAQSIAMAVHELAANASAAGALSTATGAIDIRWSVTAEGRLALAWRERGGPPPPATPSETVGYGAKVILDMVRLTLRADVSAGYDAEGFAWTLSAPPDVIAPADPPPADAP